MKLPYLTRLWDVTPVVVHITDEYDKNGVPKEIAIHTGKCNFSEKAKTIRQTDGTLIQLAASLTIGGDIAPDTQVLAGSVEVSGRVWKIATAARPRNPDGTVNHTELGLM